MSFYYLYFFFVGGSSSNVSQRRLIAQEPLQTGRCDRPLLSESSIIKQPTLWEAAPTLATAPNRNRKPHDMSHLCVALRVGGGGVWLGCADGCVCVCLFYGSLRVCVDALVFVCVCACVCVAWVIVWERERETERVCILAKQETTQDLCSCWKLTKVFSSQSGTFYCYFLIKIWQRICILFNVCISFCILSSFQYHNSVNQLSYMRKSTNM